MMGSAMFLLTSAPAFVNHVCVAKRWLPGACAAVWLLACSDAAAPRADGATTEPSTPGVAMNADTPSEDTSEPTGTPSEPGSTVPPADTNAGSEAGELPTLDPAAAGGAGAAPEGMGVGGAGIAAGGAGMAAGGADPGAGGAGTAAGGTGNPGNQTVPDPDPGNLLGTATRPQLAGSAAPQFDVLEYLSSAGNLTTGLVRDNWDPTAGIGDVASFNADFRVAASGGTHTSVQAAVTAAVSAGGTARRFI